MAQNMTTPIPVLLSSFDHYFDFISIQNVYIKAGIVLFLFIILAFLIKIFFTKFLHKLVKGTKTEIDDKIIETAKGPLLMLIITLGIFFAGRVLGYHHYVNDLYDKFFLTFMSIFLFGIIFKIVLIIAHGIKETVHGKSVKIFDGKVFPFFEKSLKLIFSIAYLFFLFKIWNINLTPLLASAGVLGLAMAFAAQDTVANVFGGISLFADRTYEIGDFIIIDDQHRGEIIDIGLRSTKLKTRDDVLIVVPNSVMANSKVINESGIHPKLRVRIDVDVVYGSDLDKVEKVLMDLAKKSDYVEQQPEPRVRFRAFKDFSVNLQLLFWIKKPVYKGRYTSHMIKDIHKRFFKEGIDFPFPTQDIYIKSMPKNPK